MTEAAKRIACAVLCLGLVAAAIVMTRLHMDHTTWVWAGAILAFGGAID